MPASICMASWLQAGLGVALGRGLELGRAVVAVEVDQRVAEAERLGHADQRVVDGLVAVGVVLAHDVAGDAGALHHGAVGAEALVEHVPEDAAVDRLQPVTHVGQGPGGDGGQRVDEVRLLHLRLELDGLDGAEFRGACCSLINVQEPHVGGVGLDEVLAGLDVLAHQDGAHLVGQGGLLDADLEQRALVGVHGGVSSSA